MTESELTEAKAIAVKFANERRDLAALTLLNKMMRGPYFSITPLNDFMSHDHKNNSRPHDTLLMIHCIPWEDIPERLRNMIPDLIYECVGFRPTYLYKPSVLDMDLIGWIKGLFK